MKASTPIPNTFCTAVTITYRIAKQLVILVQKRKVNTPGINGHACRDLTDLLTFFDSRKDLPKGALMVSAEMSVFHHHTILKAVDLLQHDLSVLICRADVHSYPVPGAELPHPGIFLVPYRIVP